MSADALVAWVVDELAAVAVPADAGPMAAYMKTDMPFLGVKKPLRKPIISGMKRFDLPTRDAYEAAVLGLWARPHREEKYMAIDLALQRRKHRVLASLPLYERLIREGQWWDLVDGVATHLVGDLVLAEPDAMGPVLERWIDDDDLWIRRTAILAHNRHKGRTDVERLFRFCRERAHEKEFFIRKAVGWVLRDHCRTDPQAVAAFLEAHGDELAGLSVREARKGLARAGL